MANSSSDNSTNDTVNAFVLSLFRLLCPCFDSFEVARSLRDVFHSPLMRKDTLLFHLALTLTCGSVALTLHQKRRKRFRCHQNQIQMTRKKSYKVYFDNEQDVIFLQDGRGNISTILAVSSGYQALLNNLIKGSK